ncbi:MAG TPA: DUF2341 domain-containing protein [Chitinivibrionales bacterium]
MKHLILFSAVIGVLVLSCTRSPLESAGGSTSTPNERVVGTVIFQTGAPASHAAVQLIPSSYDKIRGVSPSSLPTDTTDTHGAYAFNKVDSGSYTIQAVDIDTRFRALVTGIVKGMDSAVAPSATLKPAGAIRIILPGSLDPIGGYLFIAGTTIARPIQNAEDTIELDSVPAGIIPALSYLSTKTTATTVLRFHVSIPAGGTTVVWNPSWKYSCNLFLNTTAAGADVAATVTDVPILVRLSADNFTFSGAQTDGGDLRFTKSDGASIPYQIERWDGVNKEAEIWVNVDTVRGNDSTQSIRMYWGNADAVDSSSGAAVFRTAAGFSGVWHLGENGNTLNNAADSALNGKNFGSTPVKGIIGNSRYFSNGNYIKISGLLNSSSNVTLSAWVRSDTTVTRGQDIVSIGDAVLIRLDDVLGMGTAGCYHNTALVSDSSYAKVTSGRDLAKTGWHYLVFSINSTAQIQTLYIDGMMAAISNDTNPINYSGLGTDTFIGKHGNGKTFFNFVGQIDEVRAYRSAMSADYIKLCFMNQKENERLIVFK